MATTLDAIADFLKEAGLKFHQDNERGLIHTGFGMDAYSDPEGRSVIGLVIRLEEGGEMMRIVAPMLYKCPPQHFSAVLQVLNEANRKFIFLKFELDPGDGEVRAEIELPFEDASPTRRQFTRLLMAFPAVIECIDPTLRVAVEDGEAVAIEDPKELQRAFAEFLESRRAHRQTPAAPCLEE